ncbi:cytochrome P450 [Nonomuraea sp. NPDC000554]|uniref:cytochrome P450 n=1 Tax=Nonomuraea sp. NPDC000554 TaxID=3154259 RepID=UPI00331D62AA
MSNAESVWQFLTDPAARGPAASELFARLPTEDPVIRFGPVWLFSSFDLVTTLASDDRLEIRLPGLSSGMWEAAPALGELFQRFMSVQPAADHRRLRRLVAGAFSMRAIGRLRGRIDEIVDGLLSPALSRGECDFVAEVGVPLPVMATAALLDLPQADWPRILAWATTLTDQLSQATWNLQGLGQAPQADNSVVADVLDYVEKIVRQRRARPGDDLISQLASDGRLGHDELIAMVVLLFMTGLDTMTSGLTNAVYALLRNPEAWDRVVADPGLAGAAFAEGIRYMPPVTMGTRRATADIEIGGHRVAAGDTVLLMFAAANLDPSRFSRPSAFDLDRGETTQLAFGHGPYFCLGAALSLLEGESVLRWLATRAPGLEPAVREPVYRDSIAFVSPAELPLRLAVREPLFEPAGG